MPGDDLVLLVLPGVQQFIAESRSTGDLYASSALHSALARAAAQTVQAKVGGAELVLPAVESLERGVPNRVVALAPPGRGRPLAIDMVDQIRKAWEHFDPVGAVTGFPATRWVVVGASSDGYAGQWHRGQVALAGRKQVRDFTFRPAIQHRICSLTGRWPSEAPVPAEQRRPGDRPGESLSVIGRIKRDYSAAGRFPSTYSISSAPYRSDVIRAAAHVTTGREGVLAQKVADLRTAVELLLGAYEGQDRAALRQGSGVLPGIAVGGTEDLDWLRETEGTWCAPDTWDAQALQRGHNLSRPPATEFCDMGIEAARALRTAAAQANLTPPTPYLAVLAQDADRLGEHLGRTDLAVGPVRDWHGAVSLGLADAARDQVDAIESPECCGTVVYAGGDDLLALVPLATATRSARLSYAAFGEAMAAIAPSLTLSTALVFFHASWPLQSAVRAAQRLLEEAKNVSRPGLGIAVLRRGGERVRWVTRWQQVSEAGPVLSLGHIETLVGALRGESGSGGPLSASLAIGLERDRDEIATLDADWLRRELTRRAQRHGIPPPAGRALLDISAGSGGRAVSPWEALLVAGFIAAESGRSA